MYVIVLCINLPFSIQLVVWWKKTFSKHIQVVGFRRNDSKMCASKSKNSPKPIPFQWKSSRSVNVNEVDILIWENDT